MAITKIEAFETWLRAEHGVNGLIGDIITMLAGSKEYTDKRALLVDALRNVADRIEENGGKSNEGR